MLLFCPIGNGQVQKSNRFTCEDAKNYLKDKLKNQSNRCCYKTFIRKQISWKVLMHLKAFSKWKFYPYGSTHTNITR